MLPTQQVDESQGRASQLPVQPDAEIIQGSPGRQSRLKALQLVRTLPVQPEGMVGHLKDRSHGLAYPGQLSGAPASLTGPPELSNPS